jgi:hypothetical protein
MMRTELAALQREKENSVSLRKSQQPMELDIQEPVQQN